MIPKISKTAQGEALIKDTMAKPSKSMKPPHEWNPNQRIN